MLSEFRGAGAAVAFQNAHKLTNVLLRYLQQPLVCSAAAVSGLGAHHLKAWRQLVRCFR